MLFAQQSVIAANLALTTLLNEALTELEFVLRRTVGSPTAEVRRNFKLLEDLKSSLQELDNGGSDMLKHLQADAIDNLVLEVPTQFHRLWDSAEVQQWLKDQASQKRMQSTRS